MFTVLARRCLWSGVLACGVPSAHAQDGRAAVLVRGIVADRPAAGARITLQASGDRAPETARRTAALDAAGVVLFSELPPGDYRLEAVLPGHHAIAVEVDAVAASRRVMHLTFMPETALPASRAVVRPGDADAHQVRVDAARLEGLPGARTAWALADLAHPFLVSDRTDAGGVTGSEPVRVSGYGSAWTQVAYQFDEIDITDPVRGGTPLVFPSVEGLDSLVVAAAGRSVADAGSGPVIMLVPPRVGERWRATAAAALTPGRWQQAGGGVAPEVVRPDGWADISVTAGGLVGAASRRTSLFLSGRAVRARWLERTAPLVLGSETAVLTTRLTRGSERGEWSATILANGDSRPYRARARFADRDQREDDRALLAGVTWRDAGAWSAGGGYQRWSVTPRLAASAAGGVIDRLHDGPPRELLDAGDTRAQRVDLRASFARPPMTRGGVAHEFSGGASLGHVRAALAATAQPVFAELVNGVPARVWDVRRAAGSLRAATTVAAYLSDQLALTPTLTVRTGLRVDVDRGAARGAAGGIRWQTVSPRADVRWYPGGGTVALRAAYGRYGQRLTLDMLAPGDPDAPAGVVSTWRDADGDRRPSAAELTPMGAIGVRAGSGMDPGLARPTTREFLIGMEHTAGTWRWRITGVDRRETSPLLLEEVGLTGADFDVRLVADPGIDLLAPLGAPSLPIASRRASSALRDAARLTNAAGPAARYQGAEIDLDGRVGPLWLSFGGLTHRAEAMGASRGYRADENDPGPLGEVGLDPNAMLHARGRLFFDRAYVIKVAAEYQGPRLRLGAAARYQDGQPFTRVLVVEGLGQGTDAIPAYARGGQRFTYALTLDARLQWRVVEGALAADLVGEVFNLLDLAHEVEEHIVTGPAFRTVTAVQPPRAFRVGLRLRF